MEERRTYSHTEEDVVGLDKAIQEVVYKLVKTDVKVVGISGTGGLGKTTLARKVFKDKGVKDHFNDNCAWVYVSKEFEKGNIFRQILLELEKGEEAKKKNKDQTQVESEKGEEAKKKNKDQTQVEEPAGKLHKLLQEKRCLVVIDDIWTEKAWKSLKPAFESIFETTSSSKILLTTRDQGLLQQVDSSGHPHPLKHLDSEESWDLLKKKAFIGHGKAGGESLTHIQNESEPQGEMQELGREMLKDCGGLPIAIVVLGGILSTKKTISEWKDVKENLSSYLWSDINQVGGEDNIILKALELSYQDLPFYLKPCFLYFGNFPEDYKISTQRLYQLWQAEGFLVAEGVVKKNVRTLYDVGERYLNELVQRSMIQVEECWPCRRRIKTCRVHDVMREMCLRKCEEVSFLNYIESSESDTTSTLPAFSFEVKKLRRCAVNVENPVFVDKLFEQGENPIIGLRSLLVFQSQKMSREVWKCFPMLRVLDLEGVYTDYVDGVGNLIHLRLLSLRNSRVEGLPSCLYDLKYLETLDLRVRGKDKYSLCNKFHKMKRLRHLYLPEDYTVEGDVKLMFPIGGQMETIENFDPKRCEMTALMQMTNLRVFKISSSYTFEKEELKEILEAPVLKNGGQLINSVRLSIKGEVMKEEPAIFSSAAGHPWLKELKIEGKAVWNNTNSIIVFPEGLTRVDIWGSEIGGGGVSALEKLPHLEDLRIGVSVGNKMSSPPNSFPKLTQLVVSRLTGLMEWEVRKGALPNLQSIELTCYELGKWVVEEGALPNLQTLKLDCCRNLKEWVVGKGALQNLQTLEIKDCEELSKLEDNMPDSLTGVELEKCGWDIKTLLALEKLPHLKSLKVYSVDIAASTGNRICFSPGSFPHLTQLTFRGVDELEEWEVGEAALPNLQHLELYKCKNLKNLPNSLTNVKLWKCGIGDSLLAELGKLSCLETLKIEEPIIPAEGGNTLSFSPCTFPSLATLHLDNTFSPELKVEVEVGDGALPKLQCLSLEGSMKLNSIPNSLTQVELRDCKIGEGGVSLLALENLPHLQQLTLITSVGVGNKMRFSAGSFPQLTELKIQYARELEEWDVGDGALPNLQRLKLYYCVKLKKIPDGALPNLQSLKLEGCNKLKKIPGGLPDSVHIQCYEPCIRGIDKYNTCPDFFKPKPPNLMSCLH